MSVHVGGNGIARRCITAGFIGFAVDFFDIYLPAMVLTPVITYFEPKGLSTATTTTIYYFTVATTLLGRPCGAIIFGHWTDKIGRRRVTMISIAGFRTLTGLVALLPGYSTIGIGSLVLLLALRFIGGIFMGGEYTSNNTLALEIVPKQRRGFVGGLLQGAFPVGFGAVSLAASIMLAATTKQQYYDWGWRIPFLFGCALAFAFLIYYRTVPESPLWQQSEKSSAPLKEVLSGSHLRNLAQIFVMMSGFWLVGQPGAVLPSIMIQHLHIPSETTTNTFLVASIGLFFRLPVFRAAWPDDRSAPRHRGRRPRRSGCRAGAILCDDHQCHERRIDGSHDCLGSDIPDLPDRAVGDRHHLYLRALSNACSRQRLRHRLQRGDRYPVVLRDLSVMAVAPDAVSDDTDRADDHCTAFDDRWCPDGT
jgi:MFS family permease